jgi:leucine dehydrogenase
MRNIFKLEKNSQCEKIYSLNNENPDFKAIIAIHSTRLGPAIGGCRMIDYINEDEALADAIRLAKSMTYKSAMAGIQYGGGKSVIIKPKNSFNKNDLFVAFGNFVNSLEGKYITAIDSGTTMDDMKVVSHYTPYVTGYTNQTNSLLNPSYYTAHGVLQSIYASINHKYNSQDLKGKKILIKGIGNVGYYLAKFLHQKEVKLFVSDIDIKKSKKCEDEFNANIIHSEEVYNYNYNIICPCDTSYTITEKNISSIKTDIIVGATNNQLENDDLAHELAKQGILYCPDYVANSGGLIYVTELYTKKSTTNIMNKIKNIASATEKILQYADSQKISTKEAADQIAERRIEQGTFY